MRDVAFQFSLSLSQVYRYSRDIDHCRRNALGWMMGALTLCPDSPLDHWKPPQWFHLRVTSDYQKFEDLDVLFEYALADLKDGHNWQSRFDYLFQTIMNFFRKVRRFPAYDVECARDRALVWFSTAGCRRQFCSGHIHEVPDEKRSYDIADALRECFFFK